MRSICQHFSEVYILSKLNGNWTFSNMFDQVARPSPSRFLPNFRHKVLEFFLQPEQKLMTTDASTRIMKRTQMRALNVVLKESRRERGELGVLIPLIIQLYIAKKLSSNCLTRLPATCTVLICLIGHLISCTRLLASKPHLTVLEVDQSLSLVLKFYLFYLIFMFFCEQYNSIRNVFSGKLRNKKHHI